MPDIVLPHTPVDGAVSSADGISQNLYDPAAAPNSYEVINGRLNNPNRRATWDVDSTQIQRNACSGGGSVGATMSLNYFNDLFEAYDPATDKSALYQPIPGASIEIFLPYDPALVVINWTLFTVLPKTSAPNLAGRINIFQDDVRLTAKGIIISGGSAAAQVGVNRAWAGHLMIDGPGLGGTFGKGWHSISLRIAVDPGTPYSGVACRSMQYVYFS